MSRAVRLKVAGARRVLGFRELPGLNTREELLALNNRAIGRDYKLTREDVTHIGNRQRDHHVAGESGEGG